MTLPESATQESEITDRPQDQRALAATLEPVLRESCQNCLGPLTWFKTDWQRGGAATATAEFAIASGGDPVPVVVKLPVVPRELTWTQRLQVPDAQPDEDPVVARLLASGMELGGYDLAWMVIEKLPHGPLGMHWDDEHIPRIAEAAVHFQLDASHFPITQPAKREPWDELIPKARQNVKDNALQHTQRWNQALKALSARLDGLVHEWRARAIADWLHGDIHLANAMARSADPSAPVVLVDLAEVHPGHWVEDAIYLERQLWPRPERMKQHKPMRSFVDARRRHGLPVDDDYPRLAHIRRILLAATAPCYLKSEGHPVYLEACLDRLEASLGQVK